jgi:hypothetical protein
MTEPDELLDFAETIGTIISRSANGPILRRRAEEILSPRPAKLANTVDEARLLEDRVERLAIAAGGTPCELAVDPDEPKRHFDTYVNAAISEVLAVFHRARRSVIDAHLHFIGHSTLLEHPDWLHNAPTGEAAQALSEAMEDDFWENAETAYIRLASYWDRIGQLLDFFFFGIRHFERDGFAAVVDRIFLNLAPVEPELEASAALKRLRDYQTSELENGYKWLARRRNLLVHSLHLQPLTEQQNLDLFETLHNHLDMRLRKKLKPGTSKEELERLHGQLGAVCDRFVDVLALCETRVRLRARER